jgi:hypothetical protein
LLALDVLMLLMFGVLAAPSLTGRAGHEWLGFALCPVVLAHVVLQWPWFMSQFRRILAGGAWRTRANAALNYILFILMAAVLVSGIFISHQVVPIAGEHLGRVWVWSQVHSWLNFSLVVAVGLHLAINWDWLFAVVWRRRLENAPFAQFRGLALSLSRTGAILILVLAVAAAVYVAMDRMGQPEPEHPAANRQTQTSPAGAAATPQASEGRPFSLSTGLKELDVAGLVLVFVVVVGRYALRVWL